MQLQVLLELEELEDSSELELEELVALTPLTQLQGLVLPLMMKAGLELLLLLLELLDV